MHAIGISNACMYVDHSVGVCVCLCVLDMYTKLVVFKGGLIVIKKLLDNTIHGLASSMLLLFYQLLLLYLFSCVFVCSSIVC